MTLKQDVRRNLEKKTTDELMEIWNKNDREEWSDMAFEVIEEMLREQGISPPLQEESSAEESRRVAELLQSFPSIPFKKALNLDLNFRVWSSLLTLWLVLGFFWLCKGGADFHQYSTAISNIKMASSSFVPVKPEFAEIVRRLSQHINLLERITPFMVVSLIISFVAWIMVFPIRKRFVNRKPAGPKMLLVVLAALLIVDIVGVLLSWNIPAAEVRELLDVHQLRIMPFVRGLLMLALLPFFRNKYAATYYQYVSADKKVFSCPGAAWRFLSAEEIPARKVKIKTRQRRSVKATIAYAVAAAVMLFSGVAGAAILLSVAAILKVPESYLPPLLGIMYGIIVLCFALAVLWVIVESGLLASCLFSPSTVAIVFGGFLTYGLASAIAILFLKRKARKELELAPKVQSENSKEVSEF